MISVVIASRLTLLREGMKRILQAQDDIVVLAEVKHVLDVLSDERLLKADVLVAAASAAMRDGEDLFFQLRRRNHKLRVVLIAPTANVRDVVAILRTGVHGLLDSSSAANHLSAAIRVVSHGRQYIDEDAARLVASDLGSLGKDHTHKSLTQREFDIFRRLAHGQKVSAIAHELRISAKTVSTHKTRLMAKMAMTSRAQLIQYAVANSLVGTGQQGGNGGPDLQPGLDCVYSAE